LPLGTSDKLASPYFPVPLVFIYGELDWVKTMDDGAGLSCVAASKKRHGD
jgi:hypothetical protein